MDNTILLNKNHVVATLQKQAAQFTKDDIIKYVLEENIQMVNFMYPAGDGRLTSQTMKLT